jgi:hypothetical protein
MLDIVQEVFLTCIMETTTWVTHVNTVIVQISELAERKLSLFAFSEEKQYTTREVKIYE